MPEVEQAEYDNLKAEAGKVTNLNIEIASVNTKLAASIDEASGSATKLAELSKVSDESLNKSAATEVELTKLRAEKEAWAKTEEESKKNKEERDAFEKEVSTFKESQVAAARERLHKLGLKEDDTKDKDISILQAMEAGAALVNVPQGGTINNPGKGVGLKGGEGNPPGKDESALAQNIRHIEELQKRGGRAQRVG